MVLNLGFVLSPPLLLLLFLLKDFHLIYISIIIELLLMLYVYIRQLLLSLEFRTAARSRLACMLWESSSISLHSHTLAHLCHLSWGLLRLQTSIIEGVNSRICTAMNFSSGGSHPLGFGRDQHFSCRGDIIEPWLIDHCIRVLWIKFLVDCGFLVHRILVEGDVQS